MIFFESNCCESCNAHDQAIVYVVNGLWCPMDIFSPSNWSRWELLMTIIFYFLLSIPPQNKTDPNTPTSWKIHTKSYMFSQRLLAYLNYQIVFSDVPPTLYMLRWRPVKSQHRHKGTTHQPPSTQIYTSLRPVDHTIANAATYLRLKTASSISVCYSADAIHTQTDIAPTCIIRVSDALCDSP